MKKMWFADYNEDEAVIEQGDEDLVEQLRVLGEKLGEEVIVFDNYNAARRFLSEYSSQAKDGGSNNGYIGRDELLERISECDVRVIRAAGHMDGKEMAEWFYAHAAGMEAAAKEFRELGKRLENGGTIE